MREGTSSQIIVTAGLAGAVLLAAIGWQLGGYRSEQAATQDRSLNFERDKARDARLDLLKGTHDNWREELAFLGILSTSTPNDAATSTDPIATLGDSIALQFLNGYISLKQSGAYTSEKGAELGNRIGVSIRAPSTFTLHGEDELILDADTSLARVLEYRSDLREALAILINEAPPEFETFARFTETKNPERLSELREDAKRYKDAELNAIKVVVPVDAAAIHLRVVNALGSYGVVIDQLIRSVDSPFTTLVVLRTYNEAEREMLYAFDALASYYVRKNIDR